MPTTISSWGSQSPVFGIKEFAVAFVEAQKEMKSALKDAENPFFKSKYADLHSIDAACREALNSHGISISQQIDFDGDIDFIRTELLHISGEKISSRCRIINVKGDSQGFGSSVSYSRRYSLAAICGVVTEDDDGNASTTHSGSSQPIPRDDSHSESRVGSTSNEFRFPFGKFKGKIFDELPYEEVTSYIKWLKSQGGDQGRNKNIYDAWDAYKKGMLAMAETHLPPPIDDEDIPF